MYINNSKLIATNPDEETLFNNFVENVPMLVNYGKLEDIPLKALVQAKDWENLLKATLLRIESYDPITNTGIFYIYLGKKNVEFGKKPYDIDIKIYMPNFLNKQFIQKGYAEKAYNSALWWLFKNNIFPLEYASQGEDGKINVDWDQLARNKLILKENDDRGVYLTREKTVKVDNKEIKIFERYYFPDCVQSVLKSRGAYITSAINAQVYYVYNAVTREILQRVSVEDLLPEIATGSLPRRYERRIRDGLARIKYDQERIANRGARSGDARKQIMTSLDFQIY